MTEPATYRTVVSLAVAVAALGIAAVVGAESTRSPAKPATDAAAFAIAVRNPADKLTVQVATNRVVLDITSARGIGAATIQRRNAAWPATLVLRLHLGGLESLTVTSGLLTLSASVQSHGAFARQLKWTPDHVEQLDSRLLRAFTRNGQPTDQLPGPGGWFELTVPPAMLQAAGDKLQINWIDFYR